MPNDDSNMSNRSFIMTTDNRNTTNHSFIMTKDDSNTSNRSWFMFLDDKDVTPEERETVTMLSKMNTSDIVEPVQQTLEQQPSAPAQLLAEQQPINVVAPPAQIFATTNTTNFYIQQQQLLQEDAEQKQKEEEECQLCVAAATIGISSDLATLLLQTPRQ
mmetsp:Transcript_10054/g.11180  ORF Transcript_10054/g.11180 Transcript_10054/m.11180 type:complete len:160 (-) Transcript_10054:567-1046(-)